MSTAELKAGSTSLRRTHDGYTLQEEYLITGADTVWEAQNATGLPQRGDIYPNSRAKMTRIDIQRLVATGSDNKPLHTASLTYERSYTKNVEPVEWDESWTFSSGSSSELIKKSLGTTKYGTHALNYGTLIGAKSDGTVEGVSIATADSRLNVKVYLKESTIQTYMPAWNAALQTTNNAEWKTFPASTLLFLGYQANPSTDNDELGTVDFEFACSPNLASYDIGTFDGIDDEDIVVTGGKLGHEAITIEQWREGGDTTGVLKVRGVYVHQVYEESDFTNLGLSSDLIISGGDGS